MNRVYRLTLPFALVAALLVGLHGFAVAWAAAPGTWSATGNLLLPRSGHTATLLPDNRVLVAGGANGGASAVKYLASVELYDPATGSWSAASSMARGRADHTATLLPDGKVLIAGGYNGNLEGGSFISAAELYDPATGTWASTGSMSTPRSRHAAASLPDGRVLVTGGSNGTGTLSTAELYDPGTGLWSRAGTLSTARTLHTATTLPNGRVLVVGGEARTGGALYLNTAELYDPITGGWYATGSLTTSRTGHAATLLRNGRVLVAGGHGMAPGASPNGVTLASAEVYDPATGAWTVTGSMGTARRDHTLTPLPDGALLPDGSVLVAGGASSSGYTATAELYDPVAGTWSATGSLAGPRSAHTATLLRNGVVLAAGGHTGTSYTAAAELYTLEPAPGVALAPTSLAFGDQKVGVTSAPRTVTLGNSGTAPLTIGGITTEGDFGQTNTCGTSLEPGATCAINVTFTPTTTGARTGTLTIGNDADGNPHTVALAGTGVRPTVTLSPTTLTFAGQKKGTKSAAQTVTLTNSSTVPLAISGVRASGDFAQTNTCQAAPGAISNLPAGASCTIDVTFTPTATGARTGTLTIYDDGVENPHTVALNGTGTAPAVSLNPTSLDFGAQKVGTTSVAKTVTLTNTGDAVLNISNIFMNDGTPGAGDFKQTNTCRTPSGSSLAPGASCTIDVTFAPSAAGARSGILTITDDAAGSPHAVPVSGTGTVPIVALSPTSLTFAGQKVGTTSTAQAVTLTNTGNAALVISSIAVSGDFAQTNACGSSLAPGASCAIRVTFTPTATGTRTGTLTVTDDAAGSPHVVQLSGTGQRKR